MILNYNIKYSFLVEIHIIYDDKIEICSLTSSIDTAKRIVNTVRNVLDKQRQN